MIQYIHGGGTEDFCCKFGNDLQYNWVLKRLTWIEIGADNLPHERTGYYLAFDYKPKGEQYGDGHFSNWIIKISPATLAPDPDPVPPYTVTRVMCEDLGNTYDFDFNDVVFDVKLEGTTAPYTAVINLQAAGGTLPIYVGLTPQDLEQEGYKEKFEAHYLLGGTSSDKPINVDPAGSTNPVAIYRLGGFTSNSAYDVPITVINNGNAYNIVNGQTPKGEPDYSQGSGHTGGGASSVNRTESNVPQKIAMPTSVKWMNECEFIENGYSEFANWVKGGDLVDANTLKRYGPLNKLWYEIFWATEKIHEFGFENKAPGEAIGGAGAFIGIQIELTPNTVSEISDINNSVLKIAAWDGQSPIWKHLETLNDNDYYTITVVYNGDPGNGVVLPVNGDSKDNLINNMTGNPAGTPSMFPAEELIVDGVANGYYTHRFSYKKTAAVHGSGYCDYMVLFLENNTLPDDVEVTGMYISYDHEQREGSYLLPAGTYKQQK